MTKAPQLLRPKDEKKAIDKSLAEFIVIDSQPFSVVEAKGFRHLLNRLNPLYTPFGISCGKHCDSETNPFDVNPCGTPYFFSHELGTFPQGDKKTRHMRKSET